MNKQKPSNYVNPFDSFYLSEQFVKETESIISKGLLSPEIFKIPEVRTLITEPVNHFVVGVPGSGKTMALAFLTVESLAYIHSPLNSEQDYVTSLEDAVTPGMWGVYHGLFLNERLLAPHDFQGFGLDESEWITFFADFVSCNLLKRMLGHLNYAIEMPGHYIPQWLGFDGKSDLIQKAVESFSQELGLHSSCYSVAGLNEWCIKKLLKYQKMIKERTSLNIEESDYPDLPRLRDIGYIPIKLVEKLREYGVLCYDQKVHFIIDEYDQCILSKKHDFARIINSFVKLTARANVSNVNVKIGTRPHGFYEKRVLEGDTQIEKDRDYREINLMSLRDNKNSTFFSDLILDIANRRLKNCPWFSERGLVDFKSTIEGISPQEEATLYVASKTDKMAHFRSILNFTKDRKFVDEIISLIEKKTDDILFQKYLVIEACRALKSSKKQGDLFTNKDLVPRVNALGDFLNKKEGLADDSRMKYKVKDMREPALFQLANDYKQQKYYCGFETIRLMSDGVLLSFIKTCSAIFKEVGVKATVFEKKKKIDIRWQNRAIREVSKSTRYDYCQFLANGQSIQILIDELGFVFRAIQLVPTAPYPTPNGFSVEREIGWIIDPNTAQTVGNPEYSHLRTMLREATDWGYLFEKPHRSKSGSVKSRTKYSFNALLVPYFDLSPRHLKEPFYIEVEDLDALSSTEQTVRANKRNELLLKIKYTDYVLEN